MDKFVIRKPKNFQTTDAAEKKVSEEGDSANSQKQFKIGHKKGDLFACPANESLAHCISEDARMGAGIAVVFKKKYAGVDEILKQDQKTGGVAVLNRDNRHIYYLITKKKVYDKPTYDSLTASLEAMKKHCKEHQVSAVSMPRIGCGLDGLEWPKVEKILEDMFKEGDIKITVYTLESKPTKGKMSK